MKFNICYLIIFFLVVTILFYNKLIKKETFDDIKIGLLTRCKNEKYISSFVNYYLDQGVDNIYIL